MLRNSLPRGLVLRAPDGRGAVLPRGPGGVPETLLNVDFTTPGGVPSSDAWGWPDELNAYRILDWRYGDDTTPLVGPTLTKSGGTTSRVTPFQIATGSMTGGYFNGSTYYYCSTSPIDPGATEDFIGIVVCVFSGNAVTQYLVNSYASGSSGISFYSSSSGNIWRVNPSGGSVLQNAASGKNGYLLSVLVMDRTAGTSYVYTNGALADSDPIPAGTFAGNTWYLGAYTGSSRMTGTLGRIQLLRGVGIGAKFTADYAKYHAAAVLGLKPKSPSYHPFFTKSGVVYGEVGSNLFPFSSNMPVIDPTRGLRLSTAYTNKCYRNEGLVSGDETYITVSAGLSKTTTTATLSTYNIFGSTGTLYQVVNATGSDGYVTNGATAGNVNPRSVSVRAHHVAGSGSEVGLYESAGPTWTSGGAVSDSYVRSHYLVTPGADTQTWAIKIPTGCTLNFFLMCNSEAPIKAPEIQNQATAASAAIGDSSVDWDVPLTNTRATVMAEIAPNGWDSGDDGASRVVLTDSVSAGSHMLADDVNGEIAITDGTNSAAQAITETDGVYQTVYSGWGPRGIVAEVGGTQDRDSYDGAIGSGNAQTGALNRWLRKLKIVKAERM